MIQLIISYKNTKYMANNQTFEQKKEAVGLLRQPH
jgi:hypothetical protein